MATQRHPYSAISAADNQHYPNKLHDKFKLLSLHPGLHVLRLVLFENGCELRKKKIVFVTMFWPYDPVFRLKLVFRFS